MLSSAGNAEGCFPVSMNSDIERNLGEQPLARLMEQHGLKAHDLVAKSPVPISHKMVARACKGRRLTSHSKNLICDAMNCATAMRFTPKDLFTY